MRFTMLAFSILIVSFCLGCSDSDEADEGLKKPIAMDQVPPEILKVAQDKYPDLVFDIAFTEMEDGQPVYELKGKSATGKMMEVEVTKDGKLLE